MGGVERRGLPGFAKESRGEASAFRRSGVHRVCTPRETVLLMGGVERRGLPGFVKESEGKTAILSYSRRIFLQSFFTAFRSGFLPCVSLNCSFRWAFA